MIDSNLFIKYYLITPANVLGVIAEGTFGTHELIHYHQCDSRGRLVPMEEGPVRGVVPKVTIDECIDLGVWRRSDTPPSWN